MAYEAMFATIWTSGGWPQISHAAVHDLVHDSPL
jgi:hypothetical protein